jgi:hypothetical protein
MEYQRIVYGETLMSGPIVYLNSAGDHNQNLSYAIALAGHEVSSITDMWINDIEIPFEWINYTGLNGNVESGDFFATGESALSFAVHLGSSGQLSDDNLTTKFTEWTTNHKGRGITYITATCRYVKGTAAVWSAGAPNNIKALVAGKKVYDPRSDTTQSFGTGPHRLTNSLTWEYNDNPALCWADYMIDSELGFGEDSSRIDYGYVASAAEACEVTVNNPTGADPLTDNRWRCSGTLSTGDTYEANIARILSSMNGMANLVNGVWKVRAGVHVTPTLAKIKLHPDERQRFNTVRGQFIDPARSWKTVAFPEVTAAEYVTRDNNQKLYRDVSFDMTKDLYMAQRLAFGILEQSDLEVTAILPTNFKTLPVEVGGTIQYSNEKMGWTDKEFRVLRYKLSDMGGIDLVVREDDSAAYAVVGTAEYTVANDGGYTTNDPGVPPPSSLWVNPRINGVQINLTSPPARLYEFMRVYASPTSAWTDAEQLVDIRKPEYLHKMDNPRTTYYFATALNFTGEESDRIPNSDYTDVFAGPDIWGTRYDASFDLSNQSSHYWITGGSINSYGPNGDNAMRLLKIDSDAQTNVKATSRIMIPIAGEQASFIANVKISSFYGVDSAGLSFAMGFQAYYPTAVSSKKYSTNPITSYYYVSDERYITAVSGLDFVGNWQTLVGSIDISGAISSEGITLVRPFITVTPSELLGGQNSWGVLMDTTLFNFQWL